MKRKKPGPERYRVANTEKKKKKMRREEKKKGRLERRG